MSEMGHRTEPVDSQFHLMRLETMEEVAALGERLEEAAERQTMVSIKKI